MKKLGTIVMMIAMIGIMGLSTGCMSIWSYKCSEEEIAQKRLAASGDKNAISMYRSGIPARRAIKAIPMKDGIGIGLDITALDAISEHPWRQAGAALLDAAIGYGAYKIGEDQGWWGSNDDNSDSNNSSNGGNTSGGNTTVIEVNGDGNTINSSGDDNSGTE